MNLIELSLQKCKSCEGIDPMTDEAARAILADLPGWSLKSGQIEKEFRFRSYLAGLEFAYSLGKVAEAENHHPDMLVSWRRVKVMLSTHSIKGLSQNDFIMAAKIEQEYSKTFHQ